MKDRSARDNTIDRLRLRAGFDATPDVYDRVRPVCLSALFDDLALIAGLRPGARLLEIGSGTGQATLPLARRGLEVVGVELGPRLAALARRKLAAFPNVRIVNSSFEAWDGPGAPFDGIVAVHSFHWIDPEVRFARSARLLRDDGALAIVTSTYVHPDNADRFWTDVQADYDDIPSTSREGPPPHPDSVGDLRDEIEASGYFGDVQVRRYLWEVSYGADDYLALLGTATWYRQLDPEPRRRLFERIRRRIEARPDRTVRPTLLTTLNVGRRR